jgi:hypothetical protein
VRFSWRLPIYTAIGSFVVILPVELCSDFQLTGFLYYCVVAPILALLLLVFVLFRRSLPLLSILAVYCVATMALYAISYDLRTASRWFLWSRSFKAAVLAQPQPAGGELRHIDWDGWGFAGAETEVYLVYDPSDSLTPAAKKQLPGKFSGIPCEVSRVRRLENHWYSAIFYTGTSWEACN